MFSVFKKQIIKIEIIVFSRLCARDALPRVAGNVICAQQSKEWFPIFPTANILFFFQVTKCLR